MLKRRLILIQSHPYGFMIARVQHLMKRDWKVKIRHIYRKSNRVANRLAAMGNSLNLGVCFYLFSPPGLGDILRDDLVGVALPWLVT